MLRPPPLPHQSLLCIYDRSASSVNLMYLMYYWALRFLFISTFEDYETESQQQVCYFCCWTHFGLRWSFLNASHTVAAWEQNSGNQFSLSFFIQFLLILFFCRCREVLFLSAFPRLHSISLSEKTYTMTAEGICFLFVLFLKKGEKKKPQVSRSMWLCLIPYSPRQLVLKAAK